VPSGTYIFVPEGSPAPAGYTLVGGFTEVVRPAGAKHHQEVYFSIYRKN